jgi:N-methylhydantoinase B/oxoprolinase/acetone carboxylase alpha subunit
VEVGGDYGLPTRCAREEIEKDLARGDVSRDAARDDYGIDV